MEAKLIKQEGIGYQTLGGNDYYLILDKKIYHTNPLTSGLTEGGKLSLKNCQAIANGYDLDELANEYCTHEPKNVKELRDVNLVKLGFRDGFQKALSILSDKKFSINEVVELCKILMSNPFETSGKTYQELTDNYIQSLQQTEWDVEIVMDSWFKNGHDGKIVDTNPKLDADNCIILKRK